MNRLTTEQRTKVVSCLVEGVSQRAIVAYEKAGNQSSSLPEMTTLGQRLKQARA